MSRLDDMTTALFGNERVEVTASAASSETYTITGHATSSSTEGTVWVNLSDDVTHGDNEPEDDSELGTSVEMSTTVNVLEGDEVIVTVYGGVISSMVVTGVVGRGDEQDDKINDAQRAAQAAWDWADESHDAAVQAQRDADAAEAAAGAAQQSADSAAADAASASASASQAIADAASATQAATAAQGSADSAAQSARTAQQTAEAAQRSANTAQGAANAAQTSANAANAHAIAALNSLSTVEDVVDTLTWITEHGTMAKTTDTAVDPSKVYFVRDNDGDYTVGSNRYSIVQEPAASGLSSYYELTIDKSVENYIATHLSVTNEGLWLTPTQSGGYRVLVATGGAGKTYPTAGTYVIDGSGATVAQFTGTGISFADDRTFYIGDSDAYIFFDGNGHINIGGSNVTIGGSTTLAELLAKYDATITSDDISVSKTGGTATITVGSDTVTISDGAAGAQGPKGDTGDQGPQGPQGPAGHSPAITTTKNSDGSVTIYVDGTATSTVDAGEDGQTPTVTTTKNSDGSVTIYVNGTASNTVEAGADGTSYYTYVRYSASSDGKNMVTTPTSATKYIGVYTGTSSSVPAYTSFKWSKYVGEDGSDADPLTVTSHAVDYQLSTSGTMAPTGNWSTTPLAPTTTQYLWTRTTLGFSDGTTSVSYSVGGKAGTNGQNGTNGTNGTDGGRWYAGTKITGTSTTATVFSGSGITAAVVGDMYLNTSTYNTYRCTVAGNASTAKWVYTANIKGATGEQGPQGETGAKGDTGAQGPQGETGSAGTNGVSITGVEHQYYLSTSSTSQTGGSWTVKPAAYVRGRYYWERWKVSFSSGDPTYTTATLAEEVTSAWTAIESNEDAIALKANSSDVYTKAAVDGKITQEVTDRNAAITAKANEITSTVSQTYTTKQEFADLEVGGRNLIRNTGTYDGWIGTDASDVEIVEEDSGTYVRFSPTEVSWSNVYGMPHRSIELLNGKTVTISCEVRGHQIATADGVAYLNIQAYENSTQRGRIGTIDIYFHSNDLVEGEWVKLTRTLTFHDDARTDFYQIVSGHTYEDIAYFDLAIYDHGGFPIDFRYPKVEIGNKATDWSPAPEDIETRVVEAESQITQNATNINAKVSKNDVINQINLSTEGVLIDADRVEINGTAVFNAIKSSTDAAYDAKDAASTALSDAKTYADTKKSEAISTAAADATSKANAAQTAATNAANTATDQKLTSYSTTQQMNEAIQGATGPLFYGRDNSSGYIRLGHVPYAVSSVGNYSHLHLTGRIGGWGSTTSGSIDVTFKSRGDNALYNTVDRRDEAISTSFVDVLVYTGTDGFTHYWLKVNSYWYAQIYAEFAQFVEDDHTRTTTEPDGTCVWKLSEHTAVAATKSNAVKRTQRIWYRWNSATAPAAPTSWVTKSDDGSALWTKMHVAITSTHKYIYTCEQYEMADGTLGHTDVLLDNTITVIDGGNIITDSITANKLNAFDINASKTLTVGAMTDAAAATILNSNVQVGGRNLLTGTDVWVTTFNSYSSCGKSSETIPAGSVVTVSVEVNADNLVWDTTSSTHRIGFETYLTKTGGGYQYFGVWAGDAISESQNVVEVFTGSIHKRISKTFTLLGDFEVGRSGYVYTQGVAQGTVKVGRAKIEYGNRATDWSPAPEDQTAYADEVSAQSAQPNLTPFFEIAPTDTTYWFATGNLSSYTTRLEDGWSHVELSNLNLNVSPKKAALDLKNSTAYTVMLEIRNVTTLTSCNFAIYAPSNSMWNTAKTVALSGAGSYYITSVTKADLSASAVTHLRVFVGGGNPSSINADIRLSLYEGEYSCPFKPYSGTLLYATQTDADNAAKTATNYIVADSSGIKIADANPASSTTYQHQTSSGTDFVVNGGVRNRVNADGMTLYDGNGVADSNIFAKFASQLIELGRNSINSIIKLCNGVGKISVETGTTTTMRIEAESTSEINAHTYISKSALDLAQAYGAAIGGFIFKDSISTANRLSYATVTARDTGQVEIDTQRDDGSTQHLQFDDSGLAINSTKGIRGINFGYSASITNQNGIVTFNPGMGVKPTAVFVTHALASNETNDVAKLAVPFVWAIDSATQVQVRWKRTDTNDYLRNNAIGYYWLAIY